MMLTEQKDKDDYKKPAYDGRLVFYPSLMKLDDNISQAVMMGNNRLLYKLLRTLYSRVAPYIKVEHSTALKAELEKAYKLLGNSIDRRFQGQMNAKAEEALMLINDHIHLYAKDMFIPIGGDDTGEVNWDEIIGGS
jgi:hypothetical protein